MSAPDAPNTKPQATEADVPQEDLNYKEVLDKVAHEARNPPQPDAGAPAVHPLVEKVAKYVPPSVGKVLGIEKKEESAPEDPAPAPGPPERPHHDAQIEEFVRDQHRSRPGDIAAAVES